MVKKQSKKAPASVKKSTQKQEKKVEDHKDLTEKKQVGRPKKEKKPEVDKKLESKKEEFHNVVVGTNFNSKGMVEGVCHKFFGSDCDIEYHGRQWRVKFDNQVLPKEGWYNI